MHPRLTRLGREQAARAAALIAGDLATLHLTVGQIRTSDLVRARETASIIAARVGGGLVLDPRLREQHLGTLQGRSHEETFAEAERMDWSDPAVPIAGGESFVEVSARMAGVLADLSVDMTVHSGKVAILVSHGDAIRVALAHLAGVPPNEADWIEIPNGAVARIAGTITWL